MFEMRQKKKKYKLIRLDFFFEVFQCKQLCVRIVVKFNFNLEILEEYVSDGILIINHFIGYWIRRHGFLFEEFFVVLNEDYVYVKYSFNCS